MPRCLGQLFAAKSSSDPVVEIEGTSQSESDSQAAIADAKLNIDDNIKNHTVVVYALSTCPHCMKAIELLKKKNP
jgi:protein-disulfide isomerase